LRPEPAPCCAATQLEAAYNNSAAVLERDAIVADWAARSARVRREYAGRLDLAYGETRASGSVAEFCAS
jgi:hypothetical protein